MPTLRDRSPVLEVEALRCQTPGGAPVHDATLALWEGDTVALVGANGEGIETLCQCLAGASTGYLGAIRVGGQLLARTAWAAGEAGVFVILRGQHAFLEMSVVDNLRAHAGRATRNNKGRIDDVLRQLPLIGHRRGELAGNLSGGERQLLAIARALVAQARAIIVEEPAMGLSPQSAEVVFRVLHDAASKGVAVLWTGDESSRGQGVPSRVMTMARGRVLESMGGGPGSGTAR